ncbi:hypothetical protein ACFYO1_03385 [Nocardia sp. NPDC006044]|uniref:hypothetical protein n=1 Tax=Nocardia sp. NPDC006044 TaxID=3364306 RepID=UPI0036BFB0A4
MPFGGGGAGKPNAPGDGLPVERPAPAGLPEWSTMVGALAPMVAIYGKALLESIAAHTADGVAQLPRRFRERRMPRGARVAGGGLSALVDVEDDQGVAAILVTEDLPDDARLALLDLDPTEPAVRGKILMWNNELRRWEPTTEV